MTSTLSSAKGRILPFVPFPSNWANTVSYELRLWWPLRRYVEAHTTAINPRSVHPAGMALNHPIIISRQRRMGAVKSKVAAGLVLKVHRQDRDGRLKRNRGPAPMTDELMRLQNCGMSVLRQKAAFP